MAELKKNTIRIRMYRVGFGDCFLLSLPVGDGHEHILVDCGVHSHGDIGTIEQAVDDALAEAQGKFAVVIATHAHKDHISGFAKCDEKFRACEEVGEVWLPWTENPKDKTATRLKAKSLALVDNLQMHFAAMGAAPAKAQFAVMNISGNEKALQLLKSGVKNGEVKYLEAGGELKNPGGIKGLTVKILGPPRDQAFLAKMDPPAGERFLRMSDAGTGDANAVKPFLGKWLFEPDNKSDYTLSEDDRKMLEQLAADPEALAFALDQAVNNTSVVALFQYRGKYLLFPGDAQYGNWNYWLTQEGSDEILADVDFYKVGHHGSFNATPKKAVAKMTKGKFAAMASTQSVPWASIPLAKLVTAVEDQASGFVRSDSVSVKGAPKGPVVKELPKGFSQGKFWFDYEIPC